MDTQGYGKKLQDRMEKYKETPRYTTILHETRVRLGLSLVEYCVIDSIHNLSHRPNHPWCTVSKEGIGDFLNLGRATVFRAIKKGLDDGLLEKNERGDLRTTDKWIQAVVVKRSAMTAKKY